MTNCPHSLIKDHQVHAAFLEGVIDVRKTGCAVIRPDRNSYGLRLEQFRNGCRHEPGFPVDAGGTTELHAAFFEESRT